MVTKKTTSKKISTSFSYKPLTELKSLSASDLQIELEGARKELYILTMKKEIGDLKQTHLLKNGRRYIAQVSTFLSNAL